MKGAVPMLLRHARAVTLAGAQGWGLKWRGASDKAARQLQCCCHETHMHAGVEVDLSAAWAPVPQDVLESIEVRPQLYCSSQAFIQVIQASHLSADSV